MRYRFLGGTGPAISELCPGTRLDRFTEAGGTFLDITEASERVLPHPYDVVARSGRLPG
jgi:hypothetical protein